MQVTWSIYLLGDLLARFPHRIYKKSCPASPSPHSKDTKSTYAQHISVLLSRVQTCKNRATFITLRSCKANEFDVVSQKPQSTVTCMNSLGFRSWRWRSYGTHSSSRRRYKLGRHLTFSPRIVSVKFTSHQAAIKEITIISHLCCFLNWLQFKLI